MPSHSQRAKVHLDDEATKDDLPTCVKVFSIATIEGASKGPIRWGVLKNHAEDVEQV